MTKEALITRLEDCVALLQKDEVTMEHVAHFLSATAKRVLEPEDVGMMWGDLKQANRTMMIAAGLEGKESLA